MPDAATSLSLDPTAAALALIRYQHDAIAEGPVLPSIGTTEIEALGSGR
jgi:hypothetical protein